MCFFHKNRQTTEVKAMFSCKFYTIKNKRNLKVFPLFSVRGKRVLAVLGRLLSPLFLTQTSFQFLQLRLRKKWKSSVQVRSCTSDLLDYCCMEVLTGSSCLIEATLCFVIPALPKLGSFSISCAITKPSQKMHFLKQREAWRTSWTWTVTTKLTKKIQLRVPPPP